MQFAFPQRAVEYTRILSRANALGLDASIRGIDTGNDCLNVTALFPNGNAVPFSIYIRERGSYLSLGNQFKFVRSDELIERLLEHIIQHRLTSLSDLRIAFEQLIDTPWLSQTQWHEDNWAELRRNYMTCGWQFPDGKDVQECLSVYCRCLTSRSKTPLGKVPDDSIVRSSWNIWVI
jgi:hypothetical protein